ncbi:MAG: DUF3800 domain-containing protein [Phycisphaerae bacterium]|nr:DUF3800 domain-containing protein [Phycisphaerae bacterium]
MTDPTRDVRHYFVDEAGDLTLFNRRGRIVVGCQGVSRVFMVGVVHLPDPAGVSRALRELRARLMADPYFAGVPSMQPDAGKTARCFHAKDDVPEVRREVFALLPGFGAKVQVAIRRKAKLARDAQMLFRMTRRRLTVDQVYDDLVKRLFKNLLHKADENQVLFARRGKSDRQEALGAAVASAKHNFEAKWGIASDRPTLIRSGYPSESAGLQVIDYYLWALQRLYERREDRFFRLLADQYRLIMDLDDTRTKAYGQWYSDSNRLELKKIKPATD